jgi:hypothetical protein
VLERAGLIRVVRTRQVRAVTEKYYGRVARLFVIKSSDALPEGERAVAATMLRQAAEELRPLAGEDEPWTVSLLHVRLREADARRFERRIDRLVAEFRAREHRDGELFGLVTGLYRAEAAGD